MHVFKYDVVQLIAAVHERPCLWDKNVETYKDRFERRSAWEEVFSIVDDGFNDLSPEDRRITGEKIICKWTNIRDTFVKSLKSRIGAPKRKYIYYDHLKFLIQSNEDTEEPVFTKVEESIMRESYRKRRKIETVEENDYEQSTDNRDVFNSSDTEPEQSVVVDTSDARVMNEDEAFFASLLPSVAKYTEDERLEFRMEVLSVMKKIRDKRHWN